MVSFRKSLMVVALLALCAGLASAQMVIDSKATFTAQLVRNEGVTELMPDVAFTITTPAEATYNVMIISSAPITSLESALKFNGVAAATVSGNTATFASVAFDGTEESILLTGLRIDATQLPSLFSGQTTGLGENLIVVMTSAAPNATPFDGNSPIATVNGLAYAIKSLTLTMANGTSTDQKSTTLSQCVNTPYDPTKEYEGLPPAAFTASITEGFGTAWAVKGAGGDGIIGEGADSTQGTRISFTFTNVPSNVTLYVPKMFSDADSTVTLTMVGNPTLAKDGLNVPVPASGVVVYEVTADTSAASTLDIPVWVSYNAGTVPALTASAAPLTVAAQYAPQSTNGGASTADDFIPRFLGTAQSSHTVAFTIAPCNSTIMFPYITNDMGYDTGLAISNTGNLLASGGQSGTCQWSFYGNNAPTTAVPATAAIGPGTTNAALLSALAPGFTGFAVASCNFQGGYGYAFIVGNLGGTDVAQGYLGLVSGQTGDYGFYPPVK